MPTTEDTAKKLITNFLRIPLSHLRRRSTVQEDIVVILDGSGSVRNCDFDKAKQALKNMLDLGMEQGYDNKYAAVSFGTNAMTNFDFKANPEAGKLLKQIPYPSGSTNTQAGLKEAKRLFEDPASGMYIFCLVPAVCTVFRTVCFTTVIIECCHENVTEKKRKKMLKQYQGKE